MSEKIFPKGVSFFAPRENAPSWVRGTLIITPRQLVDWLKENPQHLVESEKYGKQLKLTVTDKGVHVDTWKPSDKQEQPQQQQPKDDDLPF